MATLCDNGLSNDIRVSLFKKYEGQVKIDRTACEFDHLRDSGVRKHQRRSLHFLVNGDTNRLLLHLRHLHNALCYVDMKLHRLYIECVSRFIRSDIRFRATSAGRAIAQSTRDRLKKRVPLIDRGARRHAARARGACKTVPINTRRETEQREKSVTQRCRGLYQSGRAVDARSRGTPAEKIRIFSPVRYGARRETIRESLSQHYVRRE